MATTTTSRPAHYTTDGYPAPTVTIDRLVLERLRRYIHKCDTEISGFGFATVKDGDIHIMDARVVKQDSVGVAHTDINKDALNKLMFEWSRLDGIIVWWHSHVNMGTEWSHTDISTILDLGKNGMALSIVMNKKNEMRCALSFLAELPFHSEKHVVMLDDLSVTPVLSVENSLFEQWDKELKEALPAATESSWRSSNWPSGAWSEDSMTYWEDYRERMGISGPHSDGNWDKEEFWKDAEEGKANDIDWMKGSTYIEGWGWRKSWRQRQLEKAEKQAGAKLITSTTDPDGSFVQERRLYAMEDDDIVQYWPLHDEFELVNGIRVDAAWYIERREEGDDPMLQTMINMTTEEADDLKEEIKQELSR